MIELLDAVRAADLDYHKGLLFGVIVILLILAVCIGDEEEGD